MKTAYLQRCIIRLRSQPFKKLVALLFVTLLLSLYLYGVRQQYLYVNTDRFKVDQNAYLRMAKLLKNSNYTELTDRNRMPVYPFLLSLLHEPDLSDDDFFARGKLLNIGLSLLILPILFWLFYRYLPLATAVNLILIHIFTLHIFKAAFAQTELLFYFLSFLCFLLMNHLLLNKTSSKTWKTAVFTGILVGLTHLTKASILPGLALFMSIAFLQAAVRFVQTFKKSTISLQNLQLFTTPLLVLFFFLITIWPYIQNSKERFGHYFYNVNSTFYIWYDSWEEATNGTKAHGDRVGWPDMPPEEIPSAAKYFREHSLAEVKERFTDGFESMYESMNESYGYLKHFILFFSLVLGLFLFFPQRGKVIFQKYAYPILFSSSFFVIYVLLYAWYMPIASGNRLVLGIFSSLLFIFAIVIYRLFDNQLEIKIGNNPKRIAHIGNLFNWVLGIILLIDGYIILTDRISSVFGGY
ncbi:MAG: hypothetical protein DHS20C20_10200 [Ardenticatenaceae bacterium]|nr:MAG: hypothetical protein DHS20C20_10200 [Ardenticatenaceae bacterium]